MDMEMSLIEQNSFFRETEESEIINAMMIIQTQQFNL